jgi:outer membrane receptor for ferrienterochelin and colicin
MSAPGSTLISVPSSFSRTLFALALAVMVMLVPAAQAQVTTGGLAGTVFDQEGSVLPGVTIEAVHVPTGTRYSSFTGDNGRFVIPNVRVGGPYRVTATLEGFRTFERTGITVPLGATAEVPVTLALAAIAEAITVTAEADPVINPNRTGSASSVSTEQIETLPTINRSLQDFARTNPYFATNPSDLTGAIQVAGRNNRYNSIQIDGAVNNDLFGLAASGTPGGQSDAQPISLDAIQTLQLIVSPYDVRQSGFTGGGINAVTRSGTNDFSGSVFGSRRSEDFVGDGPLDRPVAQFEQDQYGGRFGGPIIRDRLFFFTSAETNDRNEPTGVSAAGDAPTQVNPTLRADLERVDSILRSRYNFEPGSLGELQRQTGNDTIFLRLDGNLTDSHQLTLRHNYNDAGRDNTGARSSSRFTFPSATYRQANETNSTVAQLNSVFSANAYNEARIGFQTIRDERAVPGIFPSIEIGNASQNASIAAGTERFSGANALDQDILQITNDFTWLRGAHTLVFGTHNEMFEFSNLFMSDAYGAYFFPNVNAFDNNQPTEYRITFATGSDPRRATQFEAAQFGVYVNDSWRVNDNLTLNLGVRADMPQFPDTPSRNPVVEQAIGLRTDVVPAEDAIFSPRVGFNWNIGGTSQIRGGVGIFAGRAPFVWISNAFAGTGVEQVTLTCLASANCPVPAFNPDPLNQPRNVGSAGAPGTLTVDLTDPDFEFPRVLRTTLAYDRELFFGVRGTAEVVHSQTQQDVFYYNMNRRPSGQTNPLDGRPLFTKLNTTQLSDAYYLSNTSKGRDTTATLQITRPFWRGLNAGVNYAWQDSKSAFDATSSRAVSNWRFRHTPGDIFEQDISTSAFQIEHRVNANVSYDFRTGPVTHTVGMFYNVQSGRPFSMVHGNDANGDLNNSNDLLYIPAQGQVIYQFANGSTTRTVNGVTETAEEVFARFMRFMGADPYAGRITDRYEFREPWSRRLDVSYQFGIPLFGINTAFTIDILNALNMIDEDYGTVRFVPNQNTTIATVQSSVDPNTGKRIYRESGTNRWNSTENFYSLADLSSRWQAKFGIRLTF